MFDFIIFSLLLVFILLPFSYFSNVTVSTYKHLGGDVYKARVVTWNPDVPESVARTDDGCAEMERREPWWLAHSPGLHTRLALTLPWLSCTSYPEFNFSSEVSAEPLLSSVHVCLPCLATKLWVFISGFGG